MQYSRLLSRALVISNPVTVEAFRLDDRAANCWRGTVLAFEISLMSLELPFDFQRLPGSTRRLESHSFPLWNDVTIGGSAATPEALAEERGHFLTAAFGILLARYSGQASILLDLVPGPGRLALEIAATCTGREVLKQVHSNPRHGPSTLPDVAAGRAAIQWLAPGAAAEAHEAAVARAIAGGLDADLALLLDASRPHATFVYDASRFRASSVRRFAGHLAVLCSGLAANPDALTFELPLLSAEEKSWIASVCDGQAAAAPSLLVHELIARQASLRPAASALRFLDQSLSYGELEQRANGLAHYLLEHGIGQGGRVIVCVEPSFDVVIALLGILKAGAVYVPLDPSYPHARMRAILDDTRPQLIITQSHLKARLELASEAILVLEALQLEPSGRLAQAPKKAILPSQPAYIYYTSGTTGAPKGVLATHANLRHYVWSAVRRYEIGAEDVVPAIARYGFSISLFELLSPLAAGGSVLLLEREHVIDPARLARALEEVTLFHAGPSLLRGLCSFIRAQDRDFADFSRVRHASSGGDMVPADLLEALKEMFSNAEVFVIYGASEISCMACTFPVAREQKLATTYVGRPFDNVVVRVLDGSRNVLPAGVVGEVHICGAGVVEGYLNRPELTAEKFITIAGQRFYRTGDVGRLSEEGWLEILGRTDFQVKLRGMRIELAEVEHQLRLAPGVREALAAVKETNHQEKVLVAYVVTERPALDNNEQKAQRIRAIRQHMLEQLPDYMVPAVYVELDRLPVNHNLKVDRRALPDPHQADLRAASTANVREAETPTERTLASIWRRLLGVEHVGIDDNFFELGGYSLLAAQLVLEVERALGVRLEGMDILREPLGTLAAICERRLGVPERNVRAREPPPGALGPVGIFHFGEGNQLYGAFHGQEQARPEAALLICGPVGQEQVRARFVLTKLAKELSQRGVPALRFDYFGCGDSLGASAAAASQRWQTDIVEAHAELHRRTNGAPIVALGVRLGALLLCEAAPRLELSRLVLWDPVCDGAQHFAELRQMQRAYLRSTCELRFWSRRWRPRVQANELLGTTYSTAQFRELGAHTLSASLAKQRVPVSALRTRPPVCAADRVRSATPNATFPVTTLDLDCAWQDIARIEDLIPDLGISNALSTLIMGRR